ncbi:MAG: hypothetical protein ACUZ77_03780 [Candidatus Brocadiales bacterium]
MERVLEGSPVQSLLSSFSIGWQDITPGYWLVRMYTLKANWMGKVGCRRTVPYKCLPDGAGDTDLLWPSI